MYIKDFIRLQYSAYLCLFYVTHFEPEDYLSATTLCTTFFPTFSLNASIADVTTRVNDGRCTKIVTTFFTRKIDVRRSTTNPLTPNPHKKHVRAAFYSVRYPQPSSACVGVPSFYFTRYPTKMKISVRIHTATFNYPYGTVFLPPYHT